MTTDHENLEMKKEMSKENVYSELEIQSELEIIKENENKEELNKEPNTSEDRMVMGEMQRTLKEKFIFAGFWTRFWAYMIDLMVIGSINRFVIEPIELVFGLSSDNLSFFSLESIGTTIVFYLYFIFMTKFFGQTIGKMIVGIKVKSNNQQSLKWNDVIYRELIGKFISSSILMIGYVMIGFTPKKTALHDYIADTKVYYEKIYQDQE